MPLFVSDEELEGLSGDGKAVARIADRFILDLQRDMSSKLKYWEEGYAELTDLRNDSYLRLSGAIKAMNAATARAEELETMNLPVADGLESRQQSVATDNEKALLESQITWLKKELKQEERRAFNTKVEIMEEVGRLKAKLLQSERTCLEKCTSYHAELIKCHTHCDALKKELAEVKLLTAGELPPAHSSSDSSTSVSKPKSSSGASRTMEYLELLDEQTSLAPTDELLITSALGDLSLGGSSMAVSAPCRGCNRKIVFGLNLPEVNREAQGTIKCSSCGHVGHISLTF